MRWIYASWRVARMEDLKSIWNRPVSALPREAMRVVFGCVQPKESVASLAETTNPKLAAALPFEPPI